MERLLQANKTQQVKLQGHGMGVVALGVTGV